MTGVATTKADPDAESVRLVRQQDGDVPREWIEILKAPLEKRPNVQVTLLLAVPEELRAERARALARAEAHLRAGVAKRAKEFPFMTNARDWEKISRPTSRPNSADRMGLWLAHSSGRGKGVTSQRSIPEGEEFSILAVVNPPENEVGQLMTTPIFGSGSV